MGVEGVLDILNGLMLPREDVGLVTGHQAAVHVHWNLLKLVVRGVQVESVTTNLGTEDHGHVVEIAGEILELEIRRDNLEIIEGSEVSVGGENFVLRHDS